MKIKKIRKLLLYSFRGSVHNLIFKCYDDIEAETENDLQKIFYKFKTIDKYDSISSFLLDSRGWIVWKYQLFNILSLAVYSSKKINFYINGLNTKKSDIIDELQNLRINNSCVIDIITQLSLPTSPMIYTYPNLRDSLIINNELKLF